MTGVHTEQYVPWDWLLVLDNRSLKTPDIRARHNPFDPLSIPRRRSNNLLQYFGTTGGRDNSLQ